ncbi:hypothetical protein ANCDUO_11058, partial [Ancylostoma duodenale]
MSQQKERRARSRKQTGNPPKTSYGFQHDHVVSPDKAEELDYSSFSVKELTESIPALNENPVVAKMLLALVDKYPKESPSVHEEERARTIVISGIEELGSNSKVMERQAHVEDK